MEKKSVQSATINRRRFLQIIAVAGAAGLGWQYGVNPKEFGYHVVRRSQPMMGTVLNFIVCGPDRDKAEEAVTGTVNRMLDLEKRLSRHQQDSEVSQLNRFGILANASSELREVLTLANSMSRETGGAFDITILPLLKLHNDYKDKELVPQKAELDKLVSLVDYNRLTITGNQVSFEQQGMGISLDGIGKGYIVDNGVTILGKYGFHDVYVEAGGDLMVRGSNPQKGPWRIGIRNPRPASPNKLTAIKVTNKAVATSGDYMQPYSPDFRHHHILNPQTGFSPLELASCTITAPTVAVADALATGAMVLGPSKSIEVVESMSDCEGLFIGKDLKSHKTSGFVG